MCGPVQVALLNVDQLKQHLPLSSQDKLQGFIASILQVSTPNLQSLTKIHVEHILQVATSTKKKIFNSNYLPSRYTHEEAKQLPYGRVLKKIINICQETVRSEKINILYRYQLVHSYLLTAEVYRCLYNNSLSTEEREKFKKEEEAFIGAAYRQDLEAKKISRLHALSYYSDCLILEYKGVDCSKIEQVEEYIRLLKLCVTLDPENQHPEIRENFEEVISYIKECWLALRQEGSIDEQMYSQWIGRLEEILASDSLKELFRRNPKLFGLSSLTMHNAFFARYPELKSKQAFVVKYPECAKEMGIDLPKPAQQVVSKSSLLSKLSENVSSQKEKDRIAIISMNEHNERIVNKQKLNELPRRYNRVNSGSYGSTVIAIRVKHFEYLKKDPNNLMIRYLLGSYQLLTAGIYKYAVDNIKDLSEGERLEDIQKADLFFNKAKRESGILKQLDPLHPLSNYIDCLILEYQEVDCTQIEQVEEYLGLLKLCVVLDSESQYPEIKGNFEEAQSYIRERWLALKQEGVINLTTYQQWTQKLENILASNALKELFRKNPKLFDFDSRATNYFKTRWSTLKKEGKINEETYKFWLGKLEAGIKPASLNFLGELFKNNLTEIDPNHLEVFASHVSFFAKYPELKSKQAFVAKYPDCAKEMGVELPKSASSNISAPSLHPKPSSEKENIPSSQLTSINLKDLKEHHLTTEEANQVADWYVRALEAYKQKMAEYPDCAKEMELELPKPAQQSTQQVTPPKSANLVEKENTQPADAHVQLKDLNKDKYSLQTMEEIVQRNKPLKECIVVEAVELIQSDGMRQLVFVDRQKAEEFVKKFASLPDHNQGSYRGPFNIKGINYKVSIAPEDRKEKLKEYISKNALKFTIENNLPIIFA